LERRRGVYSCARGHTYDIAKSGYVNLLQPQDRRSPHAGDRRDAIVARARLLSLGIGTGVLHAVAERTTASLTPDSVVADLGCGGGELLATVHDRQHVDGIGIDLSTDATEHAARRYPHLTWVVANVDRGIPLLDRSVDVLVSLHGRRNPAESARVLAKDGRLIVAIPAADDLVELREHVQGQGIQRERATALLGEHEQLFDVSDRAFLRERQTVSADALHDLLRGTYRGARTSEADRIATLSAGSITLASEIVVFRPKR
jgi:23S rRNA (guanine745-N1)-methyltransferase